jgi:hypothetical protein
MKLCQPAGTKEYYFKEDCDWEVPPMEEDPGILYALPGCKSVADMLDELQQAEKGISCVRAIIHYLRLGNYVSALAIRRTDGDKTRAYPKVEKKLIDIFGCRMHAAHDCPDDFCKMNVLLTNVEIV